MAAQKSPKTDKGRPPDTPIFTRKHHLTSKYSYVPNSRFLNAKNQQSYIGFLEDNIRLVNDNNENNLASDGKINKSDNHLLKILCLKKTCDNNSSLENLNGNKPNLDNKTDPCTASDKPKTDNYYPEKPKNRNSFHQNVEEALSSLLWQPYEYQAQNNNECSVATSNGNNDYYDYESYSTCSYTPSSSPISLDLDDNTYDNAVSPSSSSTSNNTKKTVPSSSFLQCTAAVPPPPTPPLRRDLHSDVINLNRQETASQSETFFARPRDDVLLRHRTSTGGAFVSLLASSLLDAEYMSSSTAAVGSLVTSCSGEFSIVDTTSMHHSGGTSTTTGQQQNLSETALNSIQTDASLSAANIVGLPSSHARYASVPCNGTSGASFQNAHAITRSQNVASYPQHFRNISEPSSQKQFLRYNNAHQVPPPPPPIQQQHGNTNSQIDQHNLQLINHFRSSSVPKSMTLVPKYDVTTSSGPPSRQQNSNVRVGTTPNQNVSNVNVNFYRAVPVNVVSSVPTIHCLNTLSNDQGNSVSNVQVLPLGNNFDNSSTTQVTVQHNSNEIITSTIGYPELRNNTGVPVSVINGLAKNNVLIPTTSNVVNVQTSTVFATEVPYYQAGRVITTTAQINNDPTTPASNIVRTRTFTSTEAQTDDIVTVPPQLAREQRRRERRERRQNRRSHNNNNRQTSENNQPPQQENRLPDILNSHLPPPYSTLASGGASMVPPPPPPMFPGGTMLPPNPPPVLQTVVQNAAAASSFVFQAPPPPQMAPLMQGGAPVPVAVPAAAATGFRFGLPANGFRRSRFSEDSPKGCCSFLSWKPGSLRWFIALIALVAVCCVLVGTALGAMRPAGRDHLTVSLLMIGVGIVLITVSGVAWRLTSHDSSTCRSMLGLGSTESVDVCTRRFVPRLPPSYGRPHHPYAAMMYPEFQYRPPPPSYQASMQEYRLRLLLLDRGNTPQIQAGIQNAVSPPPTYRSHAGSLLRAPLSSRREANQSEYSCPPSYRSQNSTNRPGTLPNGSILHSRDPSLTMSESNQESVINVVNILGSTEEDIALDTITLDSLKMEPEPSDSINPLKMLLKGSQSDLEGSKDGNLVTIVQTSDQNPVIVTVSGCSAQQDNNSTVQITEIPSEMEILAHL